MNAKEWLISWFCENSNTSKEELIRHENDNYFDIGFIDSFQFLTLISDIENTFRLRFANEDFFDRNFSILTGLVSVIDKKRGQADGL